MSSKDLTCRKYNFNLSHQTNEIFMKNNYVNKSACSLS